MIYRIEFNGRTFFKNRRGMYTRSEFDVVRIGELVVMLDDFEEGSYRVMIVLTQHLGIGYIMYKIGEAAITPIEGKTCDEG